MLERYFTARMTLRRLRFGPSGPYIEGFAAVLERNGYARGDPTEKLEAIEAVVPPHLRKGSFRPPDRLIALLKTRP